MAYVYSHLLFINAQLLFAFLMYPLNWNLFDSSYLHFLFAICETIEQAMIAIAKGIINKNLLPKARSYHKSIHDVGL